MASASELTYLVKDENRPVALCYPQNQLILGYTGTKVSFLPSLPSTIKQPVLRELKKFAQENSDVNPIYLVSGLVKLGGTSKRREIRLVGVSNLEEAKQSLEHVSSEHIYCVQTQVPSDLEQIASQTDGTSASSEDLLRSARLGSVQVNESLVYSWSGIALDKPFPHRQQRSAPVVSEPPKMNAPKKSVFGSANGNTSKPTGGSMFKKSSTKISGMFSKAPKKPAGSTVDSDEDDDPEFAMRRKRQQKKRASAAQLLSSALAVTLSDDEDDSSEDEGEKQAREEAALEEALLAQQAEESAQKKDSANSEQMQADSEPAATKSKAEKKPDSSQTKLQTTTTTNAKTTGRKKRRQVEKTYKQGKYMVTEMVWEEYTDDEANEEDLFPELPDASPSKKQKANPPQASKPAAMFGSQKNSAPSTKAAPATGGKKAKKAPMKQGGIMGFFKKG